MSTETKEYMPKITASSVQEFQMIEEKLKQLPIIMIEQIESASKKLVGIECICKPVYNDKVNIYLPKSEVIAITPAGLDMVAITSEFAFVIPEQIFKNAQVTYQFIDINKKIPQ